MNGGVAQRCGQAAAFGEPKQGTTDEIELSEPLNHRNPAQSASHQPKAGKNAASQALFPQTLKEALLLADNLSEEI